MSGSATESEVECIHATHFLPVPDYQLKELQRETACDPTLQFLKKAILDGFPDTKEKQPAAIHQYFEIRDELSVHGGVIFKGQRCIITQTLNKRLSRSYTTPILGPRLFMQSTGDSILARHECQNHWLHPEMRRLYVTSEKPDQGTTYLSWAHIKALGESCQWHIHTWWQELSLHSNYYSEYFEVHQLHGKTGTVIIKKLKKHFVTHGTPNELLSGNEPPFNSAEFENFLRSSGSTHVTSSPGQQRVSHSQQCQLRGTSLNSQPKPLLQYLARPNLCAQHLTSPGWLKIGSQELVGCQSHLAI